MATGAENAAAPPPPKWEVGPTEDVVKAFIETLVDPILPSSASIDDPLSDDSRKSVAKQMHAVVLLYNYYHRKQKPDLKFLDFASFCKLALSIRPSLIPFMKFTNESESTDSNGDDENQLSSTEKAIKNACDISNSLDASKDFPTTEGFPISKVAVLLIDSKRENCLLRFGSVTDGVWSLMEKEISDENVGNNKRKRNALDDDSKFLQLGYDAVKDVAGFESCDLAVLESHVTYSLSKEKSAVKFYMMQCSQTLDTNQTTPLVFLAESSQGALAEKDIDSWSTTQVIEYYQMFPYMTFILSWLPRKDLSVPIFKEPASRSSVSSSPLASSNDGIDENIAHESCENNQKKLKPSSSVEKVDSSVNIIQSKSKNLDGTFVDKSKKKFDNPSSATRGKGRGRGRGKIGNRDNGNDKRVTRSITKSGDPNEYNNVVENSNEKRDNVDSGKKGLLLDKGTSQNTEANVISNDGSYECPKVSSVSEALPEIEVNNNNTSKKINSEIDNISMHDQGNDANMKECDDVAIEENPLVKFETSNTMEVKNEKDTEDLQNALALLYRKRQEKFSEICTIEDELALYEDRIERIREGGEVGLARRCIEYIINGKIHLLLNNESENRDNSKSEKLCDIYIPGRSSCQDLEYICLKNNWRLPKYFVGPSNGKFVSNVAVGSKDMKLTSEGGEEMSPIEARESAASLMIAKIRNRFCV